jgi:hypothetical protein
MKSPLCDGGVQPHPKKEARLASSLRRRLSWVAGPGPTVAQVYAKTLIPGAAPVPALMATTDEAVVLLPQLSVRGWAPFWLPATPIGARAGHARR